MTIRTRVQLWCDVGLKCAKEVARTAEGPNAGERVRQWAKDQGWGSWGDRDACPSCWKELHKASTDDVARVQAEIDEEELQRAIALRRRQPSE